MHAGVYVEHTGPLTPDQRRWAAVLAHWPAALAGRSALAVHGVGEQPADHIELVVSRARRVDDPPGVRTRQVRDFDAVAQLHLSPPRVRVEHAVLEVASRVARLDEAVAVLSSAVQKRRTTSGRLVAALDARPRLARRALLREVLGDVEDGAHSALERRYLSGVERAHGLPIGERQQPTGVGRHGYRDVHYREQRTIVELDGRLGHDTPADGWADLERDVDALTDGMPTLRVGWGMVLDPCRLAGLVGRLLVSRGWEGGMRACGPSCEPDRRGRSAPGADDPRPSAA